MLNSTLSALSGWTIKKIKKILESSNLPKFDFQNQPNQFPTFHLALPSHIFHYGRLKLDIFYTINSN